MANHIFVAREKCGCIEAAIFDYSNGSTREDEILEAIVRWMRQGLIVTWEERETIAIERCAEHQKLWEMNHG